MVEYKLETSIEIEKQWKISIPINEWKVLYIEEKYRICESRKCLCFIDSHQNVPKKIRSSLRTGMKNDHPIYFALIQN